MDTYLASKPFALPKTMFYGLFDMNLDQMKFEFHRGYLEMAFNPIYHDPVYDDSTEPRFIYEEFKPHAAPAMDSDDFTYEERIDDQDKVTSKRVRDTSLQEIFKNQIQIFGEVPLAVSKSATPPTA